MGSAAPGGRGGAPGAAGVRGRAQARRPSRPARPREGRRAAAGGPAQAPGVGAWAPPRPPPALPAARQPWGTAGRRAEGPARPPGAAKRRRADRGRPAGLHRGPMRARGHPRPGRPTRSRPWGQSATAHGRSWRQPPACRGPGPWRLTPAHPGPQGRPARPRGIPSLPSHVLPSAGCPPGEVPRVGGGWPEGPAAEAPPRSPRMASSTPAAGHHGRRVGPPRTAPACQRRRRRPPCIRSAPGTACGPTSSRASPHEGDPPSPTAIPACRAAARCGASAVGARTPTGWPTGRLALRGAPRWRAGVRVASVRAGRRWGGPGSPCANPADNVRGIVTPRQRTPSGGPPQGRGRAALPRRRCPRRSGARHAGMRAPTVNLPRAGFPDP